MSNNISKNSSIDLFNNLINNFSYQEIISLIKDSVIEPIMNNLLKHIEHYLNILIISYLVIIILQLIIIYKVFKK